MKYLNLYEDFDWNFEDEEDEYIDEDFKLHKLEPFVGKKPDIIRFGKYEMKLPLDNYFFKMYTDIDYDKLCDVLFNDEEIKEEFQIYNPKINNGSGSFKDEYYMGISPSWRNDRKYDFGFMPSINGGYKDPEINDKRRGRDDGGRWFEGNGYKFIGNITDLII